LSSASQDAIGSVKEQTSSLAKQVVDETRNVQDEFLSKANQVKANVAKMNAKANTLLDDGKYREAIEVAQSILSNFDSESTEAKSIIAKAQDKMKAAAQTKLGTVKEDLVGKLPSLGQ
ncbi:MAG: hypothetical protein K8I00_04250, partial [Candidatus Omnitrophica bacterium]|nr:hypothetical protein [Candidatus Omnitrophota bacterium]